MPFSVSESRDRINRCNAPSDRKRIALEALDAYEAVADRTSIEMHELAPIVVAVKSPYDIAWGSGTRLLIRLGKINPTARDANRDIILNSRKVNERFQMIATLTAGLPEEWYVEIIRQALNDKGCRVREKAAEAADRLRLKQLVLDLERRLLREEHPKTRRSLEFHAAMLRDGYILEHDDRGNPRLTIRDKDGWVGKYITKKDLDDGMLNAIINEVRR